MRIAAPIILTISLVLACFTAPDGNGVWISKNEVGAVLHATDCAKGANTKIVTAAGSYCVLETPAQVRKLLEDTK